jgi:hypothetical protein
MKGNWNNHTWLRNCPVQHAIERKAEGYRKEGRRSELILDDRKKKGTNIK